MTISAAARFPVVLRRRCRLLAVLLLAATNRGGRMVRSHRSSASRTPPPVPADQNEPEVTVFIEKSRQRVSQGTEIGPGLGNALGQAFLANLMEEESLLCFAEAERLDPSNPRWPYYQGGVSLLIGEIVNRPCLICRRVSARCGGYRAGQYGAVLAAGGGLAGSGASEGAGAFYRVLRRQPDDLRAHLRLGAGRLGSAGLADEPNPFALPSSPFTRQKARVQLATVSQRLGHQVAAEKYRRQADQFAGRTESGRSLRYRIPRWSIQKKERYRLIETLEGAKRFREAADTLQSMIKRYPNDYSRELCWARSSANWENTVARIRLQEACV